MTSSREQWRAMQERIALNIMRNLGREADFDLWQRAGLHLTPVHYYSPIPDTQALPDAIWSAPPSTLPGIDLREPEQLALLTDLAKEFGKEFNDLPRERSDAKNGEFYIRNKYFESVDAEIAYSLMRLARPERVVEIGSGFSTMLTLKALDTNERGRLESYEPFPPDMLRNAAGHPRFKLDPKPVQEVPLDVFTTLAANDVLFIDSSHVARIGSDVLYEILQILPRLKEGVLVHIHDIFLPGEYPKTWVKRMHRFWNEQYLLQAFLTMNPSFQVLWASSHMHVRHPGDLAEAIESYDPATMHPGSFWLRRI